MHPVFSRGLQPNWGAFVQKASSATSVVAFAAAEQSELRRIARGLGEAEMAERVRGQQSPARGTLQIAALDQDRCYNTRVGMARPRQRRRHGFDADGAAAVIHRDGGKIAPVHGIEPRSV